MPVRPPVRTPVRPLDGPTRGPNAMPLPPDTQRGTKPGAEPTRASDKHYPYKLPSFFAEYEGAPKTLADECHKRMVDALKRAAPGLDAYDLDPMESSCLAKKLYALCVSREMKGKTDEVSKRIVREADETNYHGCSRHSLSPRVLGLYEAVVRVLD